MKTISILFFVLISILLIPHTWHQYQLNRKIKTGLSNIPPQHQGHSNQSGVVRAVGIKGVLTESYINRKIKEVPGSQQSYYRVWLSHQKAEITTSAMGIDRQHHFSNSYLVGFQPFETDQPWVPLYTLAIKKKYQYDHLQYSGLADVWQNSQQAFAYSRGDCEDHAIALADWLIEMGKDARVVIGDHDGNGHAWVILFQDNKEYLLEATSKRKSKTIKHYPIAGLMSQYHPKFQFNRSRFWVNTGPKLTTRYRGSHWVLRSYFEKSSI